LAYDRSWKRECLALFVRVAPHSVVCNARVRRAMGRRIPATVPAIAVGPASVGARHRGAGAECIAPTVGGMVLWTILENLVWRLRASGIRRCRPRGRLVYDGADPANSVHRYSALCPIAGGRLRTALSWCTLWVIEPWLASLGVSHRSFFALTSWPVRSAVCFFADCQIRKEGAG
jgi:hypothetical protein